MYTPENGCRIGGGNGSKHEPVRRLKMARLSQYYVLVLYTLRLRVSLKHVLYTTSYSTSFSPSKVATSVSPEHFFWAKKEYSYNVPVPLRNYGPMLGCILPISVISLFFFGMTELQAAYS